MNLEVSNKERDLIKEKLLNEVFTKRFTESLFYSKKLIQKLEGFLVTYGFDTVISEAILLAKMRVAHSQIKDFEECSDIVKPIFKRLLEIPEWSGMDITFATSVVSAASNYKEAADIMEKGLKYKDLSEDVKANLLLNGLGRILEAKFKEKVDLEDVTKVFYKYLEMGIETCKNIEEEYYNTTLNNIFLLRKAIFEKDDLAVRGQLKLLKQEKFLIKGLRQEVERMKSHRSSSISKIKANEKLGRNFKTLREERKISLDEIAEEFDVTTAHVKSQERGVKVITPEQIYILNDLFNISPDILFYNRRENEEDEIIEIKKNINFIINNFSKEQLEIIHDTVINIKKVSEISIK